MRENWLYTTTGLNTVAFGLVAIMISLAVFTFVDCTIVFTGKAYTLRTADRPLYLLCAFVAVAFSILTAFIWRRGWPRVIIALFGASMASHIVFQFVRVPVKSLQFIALCRILVAAGLIALVVSYRFAERRV